MRREEAPHYLWVFRGDPQPDRLRSAINMLIRRVQPAIPQADINRALLHHLPFVAALRAASQISGELFYPDRLVSGYTRRTAVPGHCL